MRPDLTFGHGLVSGSGKDAFGAYFISGHFDDDGTVNFRKRYLLYPVRYLGHWDGIVLVGRWQISVLGIRLGGDFEMWPEVHEVGYAFNELFSQVPGGIELPAQAETRRPNK